MHISKIRVSYFCSIKSISPPPWGFNFSPYRLFPLPQILSAKTPLYYSLPGAIYICYMLYVSRTQLVSFSREETGRKEILLLLEACGLAKMIPNCVLAIAAITYEI